MHLQRRRALAFLAAAGLACAGGARGEGLALGAWQAGDGVYRSTSPSRALYYLTDQPYVVRAGVVEAVVTVRRRLGAGGWGAAALLLSSDPQSFWTLSLVEGPDGDRYCECIELYQGIHQAQSTGTTRLVRIEDTFSGAWRYDQPYLLRLELTPERLVGEIRPLGGEQPLARLGWLLSGATAVRSGWAALRSEQFDSEFTQVRASAAPQAAAAAAALAYPQGARGCVGLYFGAGLPGAEVAPAVPELERALGQAGFAVVPLGAADLAAEGALSGAGLRCLVGDWRRLPAGAMPDLLRWLQQGGLLVSVTAPAFSEFHWRADGRWLGWSDYAQHGLADLGKQARRIVEWSPAELASWHSGQGGHAAVEYRALAQPGLAPEGQAALELTLPAFSTGWWSLGRHFAAPPAAAAEAVTCFWAKADATTPELSLEWAEQDGSRWVTTLTLSPEWRCYALAPQAFAYWNDNPAKGRGGPGDALRLAEAVSVQVAVSQTHTAATLQTDATEHRVWLGPLGLAPATPAALAALVPVDRPEMEALSPGYKLCEIPAAGAWQATPAGERWGIPAALPAVAALGAIERPGGEGMDRGHWWRWLPLVASRDAKGVTTGTPMSLILNEMLPFPRCAWVSLGLQSLADFARPELQQAAAAAITRVTGGPLLFEAGARHFLWRPGEEVAVGARVVNHSPAAARASAVFRLSHADGTPAAPEVRLPVTVAARGMVAVHGRLGALEEGQYILSTELLTDTKVSDLVEHPLSVRAVPTAPPPAAAVVQRDAGGPPANPGRLLLGGKPWHPVGTNYWPHLLGGIPGAAYWGGWLDPSMYVPQIVEADLAQMASWGFTAIAGVGADVRWDGSEDSATLRNLEDFLWRCERHHIKVFFFCAGLDPRGRDEAGARSLIKALRYHPALAAYDIAWEPGYYEARHGYAAAWRAWLTEHYGSLDAAEEALGQALPRTAQGEVAVPPDAWCDQPGPWLAVAAAYRAYMDWQLGAEYRRSARIVRDLDPLHLVGFRGSNVTSPLNFKPVEQPSVLHFMDWAGPEGYDVPAYGRLTDAAEVGAKGLCTRLLSYLSGGKPVLWMEFGMPVYPNGTTWRDSMAVVAGSRLEYQVEEGRRWWQMMVDSGAWGSFQWWYPGGFRVGENSDCGLVAPNNLPRPVAATAQHFAAAFAASEDYGRSGLRYLEGQPEDGPGGWIGLYLRCRDRQGAASLRPPLLDSASPAALQTAAAGGPWPGRGPLRFLNAIVERLRLRVGGGPWQEVELPTTPAAVEVKLATGGPLELEAWVGNTAEATWLPAGTAASAGCRLAVSGDAQASLPLHEETRFQGSGHCGPLQLAERLDTALHLRLQMQAGAGVGFGEIVRLALIPSP